MLPGATASPRHARHSRWNLMSAEPHAACAGCRPRPPLEPSLGPRSTLRCRVVPGPASTP
eukprot:7385153-Prymnesium_polylepis.2